VSENDNCHCAGNKKVAVKVIGRKAWRGKPSGNPGKQCLSTLLAVHHTQVIWI